MRGEERGATCVLPRTLAYVRVCAYPLNFIGEDEERYAQLPLSGLLLLSIYDANQMFAKHKEEAGAYTLPVCYSIRGL